MTKRAGLQINNERKMITPEVIMMSPPKAFVVEVEEKVLFDIQNDVIKDKIANIVSDIAEENECRVIDLYTLTEGHAEWFDDGVHPNAEGNKEIAAYIADELKLE